MDWQPCRLVALPGDRVLILQPGESADEGCAAIYDIESGGVLVVAPSLRGWGTPILTTPDGRLCVPSGHRSLVVVELGRPPWTVRPGLPGFSAVSLHPTRPWLAVSHLHGVSVVDYETGREVFSDWSPFEEILERGGSVAIFHEPNLPVAFTPDGRRLVGILYPTRLVVVETAHWSEVTPCGAGDALDFVLSPDSRRIAVLGPDGVRLLDLP